jgi:hypothetical protein
MFSSNFKRHAAQFAISAALAVGTPAAAAGLVEGVRVAATTVDQAGTVPSGSPDDAGRVEPAPEQIATHDPVPLSHLVAHESVAASKTIRATNRNRAP